MSGSRPRACVFLSLYRGTRHLRAQLGSLAAQTDVDLILIMRDDGSDDDTAAAAVATAADLGIEHVLHRGSNLGPAASFLQLMLGDLHPADLYAFCDQDDVWRSDKLARAVAALANSDRPMLYAARACVTDADLRPVRLLARPRRLGFGNALVQNVLPGATIAMNHAAIETLRALGRPAAVLMHDWWCYLVLSALGYVVYDDEPTLMYRQHGSNVVGAEPSGLARWVKRWKRRRGGARTPRPSDQAAALLAVAGARLTDEQRIAATLLVGSRTSWAARARLVVGRTVWRDRTGDDLAMRALLMVGKL